MKKFRVTSGPLAGQHLFGEPDACGVITHDLCDPAVVYVAVEDELGNTTAAALYD